MKTIDDPVALFAASVSILEQELPWEELGPLYCDGGGQDFFSAESIESLREAGLKIATEVSSVLEGIGEGNPERGKRSGWGSSLYFGAAVAELIPALCETIVLGRSVRLLNLPGPEPKLINGALGRTEQRLGSNETGGLGGLVGLGELAGLLPRIEVDQRALERSRFDHLWVTSVLSDPEAFPALHDELYDLLPRKGRSPSPGKKATGRGNLPAERKQAKTLVRRLVSRLEVCSVLTTSQEELALFDQAIEERGLRLAPGGRMRLSAIVGDPIASHAIRG